MLQSYPLFNKNIQSMFGGAEVRSMTFARGLSSIPGYEVSFIVYDHGQPAIEQHGGITVYAHPAYRGAGNLRLIDQIRIKTRGAVRRISQFPFIKISSKNPAILAGVVVLILNQLRQFLMWKLRPDRYLSIEGHRIDLRDCDVYERVNADIYCVFGVNNLAAQIIAYAKSVKKKSVLFAAYDPDFSETYRPGFKDRNEFGSLSYLCHYAITNCDKILVQTQTQAQLLKERFGRDGRVIENPISLQQRGIPLLDHSGRKIALWVGRSNTVKRPQLLLQIAAQLPTIDFVMVMNRSNSDIYEEVMQHKPSNVSIIEQVPFEQIETLFSQAFVYISTSAHEGFPNTFLQAGKYGVPVASLEINPDQFLTKYKCGFVSNGDLEQLAASVRLLREDEQVYQFYSQNISDYVISHHELGEKVQQFDAAVRSMLEEVLPSGSEFDE
jgi:glycosyltransferase involved in cell wall biosynthesis